MISSNHGHPRLQLNIAAIFYMTTGAASTSFLFHVLKDPSIEFPSPEIHLRDYDGTKLTDLIDSSVEKNGFTEYLKRSSEIILIKSFREIEEKYINYFSELVGKDIIPVGAIVEEPNNKDEQSEIIEWLDKKDESSTVFVSFGSEYFLSEMEMKGIAHGLELSNVNFIWLVRFPGGEKIRVEEALPEGFIERIGERGMVVEGWAPQGKILAHASIGGFVSHCGWSSLMESMKYGVPIIAIPMHVDQPLNARLVDHIAIGVEVVRDENGRLEGEKVATVIKNVVVEKNGVVGKKVRELADDIEKKGEEEMDGVSQNVIQDDENVADLATKEDNKNYNSNDDVINSVDDRDPQQVYDENVAH
ncbi:hypothetical protein F0562_025859 [Nyssa sinensis]|uniref:Uncharacterized protein n=1 Tax=Nyssa sinensis TaxID=561372 RepID=A0A5J5BBN0_9ASTE|nr:hypothetical protein F0562_025859 [Nyssa sinensis]